MAGWSFVVISNLDEIVTNIFCLEFYFFSFCVHICLGVWIIQVENFGLLILSTFYLNYSLYGISSLQQS